MFPPARIPHYGGFQDGMGQQPDLFRIRRALESEVSHAEHIIQHVARGCGLLVGAAVPGVTVCSSYVRA
ncbi:hypothetical protein J6590_031357 [Homalodisca vitripennis]|nr:hypothetical protein J6590_031357 [Homalodisca vitripennis]